MSRYPDVHPNDIDPETGAPYAGYSSPALDTSFHDHEMDVDEPEWSAHVGEDYAVVMRRDETTDGASIRVADGDLAERIAALLNADGGKQRIMSAHPMTAELMDSMDEDDDDRCTDPGGHVWPNVEEHERCLCIHCGADGDA